ncbi:MAG: preprotein translocase subunit SecG [Limisphaerales bacterium]
MVFIIGLLTAVMVLTCFVLILLILLQLPKKEAGAGLAFGGAASDALFGAGSGTVLTKITKYLATVFFVLAVVLSLMQSCSARRNKSDFRKLFAQPAKAPAAAAAAPAASTPPAATPTPSKPAATSGTNMLMTSQAPEATNSAPAASTNKPPAPSTPK